MGLSEHIDDIASSYAAGESMQKIAKRYGVSRQAISALFKKYNIKSRTREEAMRYVLMDKKHKRDEIAPLVIKKVAERQSMARVAEDLGLSLFMVRKILRENGYSASQAIEEVHEEIYRYVVNNPDISYRAVAEKMGVSILTVIRVLQSKGYSRRRRKEGV